MKLYRCEACWKIYGVSRTEDAPKEWTCQCGCQNTIRMFYAVGEVFD